MSEPRARAAKNRGQQNFTEAERTFQSFPMALPLLIPTNKLPN